MTQREPKKVKVSDTLIQEAPWLVALEVMDDGAVEGSIVAIKLMRCPHCGELTAEKL